MGNAEKQQHVFIIGSKGIPASYGGFETFVEKLTEYKQSPELCYHVACLGKDSQVFIHNNARCFRVPVPDIGPAKAIWYDVAALRRCIRYCIDAKKKDTPIEAPVFYILACRIGPFIGYYKRKIKKLGGNLYVNPDGHEWKRSKWSLPVRLYWKFSERLMVKHADLLICDSKGIEQYIQDDYRRYHPKTTYLSYGAEIEPSTKSDQECGYTSWCQKHQITPKEYYLTVGRFVPENNFETILREYMKLKTKKQLVVITTEDNRFYQELDKKLQFSEDNRIKFVGTVYDQELLARIRKRAFAYIHGHEVGGTNPSLLEALSMTDLNLLLNVSFNSEVGEDTALYWTKDRNNLMEVMSKAEKLTAEEVLAYGRNAHNRIATAYNWNTIAQKYEALFLTR